MGAFKAYDIRGIYNEDFCKEDVYKMGFFLPELLNAQKILVGHDARVSSPEIFAYLSAGIQDAGADVYDLGPCTTPLVYWATVQYGFTASVMITASHNPKNYNGLKVSTKNAIPVSYETGLNALERAIKERVVAPKALQDKGKLIDFCKREEYIAYQKQYVKDFSNLKVVIDCSNGMTAAFVHSLYGEKPEYILDEIDCSFPNHEANPLEAENRIDLQKKLREVSADVGLIFDGDGDRVMFIDEKSNFVSPDLVIALLAHHFLKNSDKKEKVLQDIRSSKAVKLYLDNFGAQLEMWKVGRAFAAPKLREIDGIFGGELAGHYYFRDFNYSDSGLMAASIVLGILSELKNDDISFSQIISKIKKFESSGEINFKLQHKEDAMEAIKRYFSSTEELKAFYDFDGYRMESESWWLSIRMSNTEPYLRLIIEAQNKGILEDKLQKAKEIIEEYE